MTEDEREERFNVELKVEPLSPFTTGAASTDNDTMQSCREIVKKLLHQVSFGDSPPSNEDLSLQLEKKKRKRKKRSGQSRNSSPSNQCPSPQEFPPSPNAALWNYIYTERCENVSEHKMGHVALATLCQRTLESTSNDETKKAFFPEILEDDKESQQNKVKLQQFGSEYARYLSNTALKPNPQSSSKSIKLPKASKPRVTAKSLEDASSSVLTGAITDIQVVVHQKSIKGGVTNTPKGYVCISQTASGSDFCLPNKKAHLYVKKEPNWDRAAQRPCVTCLTMIFPKRQEFVPPGYSVVQVHGEDKAFNFSYSSKGGEEPMFLCFRRSREGNPITGLLPLSTKQEQSENIPQGFTVLERTPRNFVASFGPYFWAYRQRLANLEALRPLPLTLLGNSQKKGYYATGASVVECNVGRFHILDRSTHFLLSPKSVANRLSVVQASRQKALATLSDLPSGAGNTYQYSSSSNSVISREDSFWSSTTSFSSTSRANTSFSSTSRNAEVALSFIPMVECPSLLEHHQRDFSTRVALLTPILTACYTRHGHSCWISIQGLLTLLLKEQFFSPDVVVSRNAYARLTLLDLAVEVVCDVAFGGGGGETLLSPCVEFVSAAIKFTGGHLNTRTIGYVLRLYLYSFYFGVTLPGGVLTTVPNRNDVSWLQPSSPNNQIYRIPVAKTAFGSLQDLISCSIARLRSLVLSDQNITASGVLENITGHTPPHPIMIQSFLERLMESVVDQSLHRVHRATYAQLALQQIHRAGGSELFWYDMKNTCGRQGLFQTDTVLKDETLDQYSLCFALLAHVVKVACAPIRRRGRQVAPRDIASKLMSLELLHFFLREWDFALDCLFTRDESSEALTTFLFTIRRLVVPCLLSHNTQDALHDPRVFQRILNIVGTLVTSSLYKKHIKMELRILVDHFILKVLKLGPQIILIHNEGQVLFHQQLQVMVQLQSWLSSSLVFEWFINFEECEEECNNYSSTKVVQELVSTLCYIIAEQCGTFLTRLDTSSKTNRNDRMTLARTSASRLQQAAMVALTTMLQCLARAACASHKQYETVLDKLDATLDSSPISFEKEGDSIEDELVAASSFGSVSSTGSETENVENVPNKANMLPSGSKNTSAIRYWKSRIEINTDSKQQQHPLTGSESVANPIGVESVKSTEGTTSSSGSLSTTTRSTQKEKHLNVFLNIANNNNLSKAIEYLLGCNILSPNPRGIASFLRIHRTELKPTVLGTYLGQGGGGDEIEFYNLIRFNFIRAISFVGMTVEQGIRHLLTNGGFKLPGEAQQIDRIITTFSECYWEDNAGDHNMCPFRNQESLIMLSFAIIMLNTDLHKYHQSSQASTMSCHPQFLKKMTKSEFLSNLRGVFKSEKLNTKYLSSVYDSIAARPIVMREEEFSNTSDDLQISLEFLMKHGKTADALLRGLAVHEYTFTTLREYSQNKFDGDSNEASRNLSLKVFRHTWHHFHSLVNIGLDVAHLGVIDLKLSVNMLKYALFLTICLDGCCVERSAFVSQLGRLHRFQRVNASDERNYSDGSKEEDEYFQCIQDLCQSCKEETERVKSLNMMQTFFQSFTLFQSTPDSDKRAKDRLTMRDTVAQLKNSDYLMNDPNRTFLRQADLIKEANATGRKNEYRFVLFSDLLLYAKKCDSKSLLFKTHEELPLLNMKVVDWFPPETKDGKRIFQIFHPRKKVMVFCSNEEEKRSWVISLRSAIEDELQRNVMMQTARMAALMPITTG